MEHKTSKGDQMQASHRCRKPLIVTGQASKPCDPGKGAFDDPAARQQHKAMFGLGEFDDFQLDSMRFGLLSRGVTGRALINEDQFHRLTSCLLHAACQLTHVGAVLLIGRRDQQGQQMAQRINGDMYLAAFAALGPVVAGMSATFRCGLQHAAVKNGDAGLSFASFDAAQQQTQVLDQGLETPCGQPSLCLLLHDRPGRQIMRHHPPGRSCTDDPAQSVEYFSQGRAPLFGIFR